MVVHTGPRRVLLGLLVVCGLLTVAGLVWLWPLIDVAVKANLREDFLEIPSQTCITMSRTSSMP